MFSRLLRAQALRDTGGATLGSWLVVIDPGVLPTLAVLATSVVCMKSIAVSRGSEIWSKIHT